MTEIVRQLQGDFVLLDLGSANSEQLFRRFPRLQAAATLVAVDAREDRYPGGDNFYRRICVQKAIAGTGGKRPFYSRRYPECSSFLEPKADLVAAYGLEPYFDLKEVIKLDCITVNDLLAEQGLTRVDFFKTDLEGLDLEVLKSAPEVVSRSLCVQCEVRFQPIFQNEPPYHEVAAYLAELGLELVYLRPDIWKYKTPHRRQSRDGRTAWADALFFLRPDEVMTRFPETTWKAFAKQVILARLLGLPNFAEALFLQTMATYPPDVALELRTLAQPRFSIGFAAADWLARLPFGQLLLEALRRLLGRAYLVSALYKDDVIGVNPPR